MHNGAGDLFRRGIQLFNEQQFYECHEVLEDLWRPTRGPNRLFLQAIIHFAVGFYHHQRGNQLGAERQLRKGLRKFGAYLPKYEGVESAGLFHKIQASLEQIQGGERLTEFPRIDWLP